MIRQARRAARLVDDLLLMTRLDTAAQSVTAAPTDQRQLVDPLELLQREIGALRLRRPDLVLTVVDHPPVLVLADPDQLQRALGNLLENAAAASGIGGRILVATSLSAGLLSIRIIDSGPGIQAQDSERIFDRFVRLSSSRQGDGSGLGLPISRAMAQGRAAGDLRVRALAGRSPAGVVAARAAATSKGRSRTDTVLVAASFRSVAGAAPLPDRARVAPGGAPRRRSGPCRVP